MAMLLSGLQQIVESVILYLYGIQILKAYLQKKKCADARNVDEDVRSALMNEQGSKEERKLLPHEW